MAKTPRLLNPVGLATATASGLISCYEEGTFTARFNLGMNTSNTDVIVKFVRVGNQVTLYFPITKVTANVTAAVWQTAASQTPTRLLPQAITSVGCVTLDSNAGYSGFLMILTDGSFQLYKYNQANWTSGTGNCGLYGNVTYTLT